MQKAAEYTPSEKLANLPPLDGNNYILLEPAAYAGDPNADAYVAAIDACGNQKVLAFIDASVGAAYPCSQLGADAHDNPRDSGEEPLVKLVGEIRDETGQVVIKQVEGHWRRYSRWDRIKKAPPTQPRAIVRTLPQCGCGGYLGAPSMFDSFKEMLAYFFVVFSDAEAVNAKHAAVFNEDACCTIPQ